MIFQDNIHYMADSSLHSLFYSRRLKTVVSEIAACPMSKAQYYVHSDATLKSNLIPTGFGCISPTDETVLIPGLLRDPGCGFLQFRFDYNGAVPENWQQNVGQVIHTLVNTTQPPLLDEDKLTQILSQGLLACDQASSERHRFAQSHFPVDMTQIQLSQKDKESLIKHFATLTNTIEIKALENIQHQSLLCDAGIAAESYMGFIHTGCMSFPGIIIDKFTTDICYQSYQQKIFSLDNIEQGIYGIWAHSPLGEQYIQYVRAAMNYALASRYTLFTQLKQTLEAQFPCELTIVNDRIHAGLFEQQGNYHSIRGIQQLLQHDNSQPWHDITLLAGQRESLSALITPGKNAKQYAGYIGHGTSEAQSNNDVSNKYLSSKVQNTCMNWAQQCYYNTKEDVSKSIPYTASLLASIEYGESIGLIELVALCKPLVNVQSKLLIK